MSRSRRQSGTVAASVALAATGLGLWRWKRRRLASLAANSELVETDRGVVEVARRGSGPPVLVLHGAPGGYDQGLCFGEALFGDDVEVIAPSRPGYLRTPLEANGSPSAQAAQCVALMDELGVERAVVAGYSSGGPAALHLAVEHPERVSGLVLGAAVTTQFEERAYGVGVPVLDSVLTSTPFLDVFSGALAALARLAPGRVVALGPGMSSTLDGDELRAYVESVASRPTHRERVLALAASLSPASARVDGVLNDERWQRRLPLLDYADVACPTLVLTGAYDALVPRSHAEYVLERIPDVEHHEAAADHILMVGPDAAETERVVDAFVDTVLSSNPQSS
ncbi:alpha/beta hydrolase [Halorubellus litoreus]|uniref:Alpha/beta fold hydrolase n=1 Tax=Halorubellus litoreus TaxID=755308 RepID=A0ABD5VD09_9EURY